MPKTFTSVVTSVILKALLEKAFRLTVKGEVLSGNATTLEAYPAFNPTATSGAKYNESVVEDKITTLVPSSERPV